MTVSLCIIAFNEEEVVGGLLSEVLAQSYPKAKTEIVLVNSASTDGTRKIFCEFAKKNIKDYWNIAVLDNPKRLLAAGWNTAIRAAAGYIIFRVDAHASIPPEFVEKNAALAESGEYVCGGARPNTIDSPTPYKEMLLLAESSMFGSSFASYRRRSSGKKYVDSLFHAAYRREVFEKVGGFNESLGRTEDNELHYRIRQNGFKICQSEEIISYQQIRPTLSEMAAQKYGNGKWIGLTLGVCPGCLSVFHFAPFCLVLAFMAGIILAAVGAVSGNMVLMLPLAALAALYVVGDIVITLAAVMTAERKSGWLYLLPLVFPALHFSYGAGTLTGIFELPFWKRRLDGSAEKEIEKVKNCVINNTKRRGSDVSV